MNHRLPSLTWILAGALALSTCSTAWAQGNSTTAHWVLENVGPRLRGAYILQGAKGSPVPTLTNTQTPTQTPTLTNTQTPTETPTATASPTNTLPRTDCADRPDGSTCDAGHDFGNTLNCIDGECVACVPDADVSPRFVDNGDRTITDRKTCWVWEKKTSGTAFPHGVDLKFKYSEVNVLCNDFADPCPPNGTAFTQFLAALNFGRFAGHSDWRIPTMDPDASEMESLLTAVEVNGLCIDPLFSAPCPGASELEESCTAQFFGSAYGSSTTIADYDPTRPAWYQGAMSYVCSSSLAGANWKIDPIRYRAVRGGVVFVL